LGKSIPGRAEQMSTTLIEQTITFIIDPDCLSKGVIFADPGVQAAIGFSHNQYVMISTQQYTNFANGFELQVAFTITCWVSIPDALTIIGDIAAMKTRLTTAGADFYDIVTWSTLCVYS
jgi:hypothetical protein